MVIRSTLARSVSYLLLIAILGSLVAACASATATGPPEIKYGRDVCVECSMVISEARFAAAYRLDDGTEKLFDDIGGMLKHGTETGDVANATAWVHDFQTEEWIEADVAFYVPTRSVATPMGHGVVAFADLARAMEFATGVEGEVVDWTTVVRLPVVDGLIAHDHDAEGGSG